jgi:acyl carrier protein
MAEPETLKRLTTIFHEVFDDESIVLRRDLTAEDVAGWDSASHIMLIVAIELRFGIRFSTAELDDLKDLGALIDLTENKARHKPTR